MQLDQKTVELFLAVRPAFIASLPRTPPGQDVSNTGTTTQHRAALEVRGAIIHLRTQVQLLFETFPEPRARYNLSDTNHAKASQAFDDLLFALGELLDDAWDSTSCPSSGFQKLVRLKEQLVVNNATTVVSEPTEPRIHVRYFRPNKGPEAVQYRYHTRTTKYFNDIMIQIFASEQAEYSVSMGDDFHDRSTEDSDEDDQLRELLAYKNRAIMTNTMMNVILERHNECNGHPTYINISRDVEDCAETSIETVMTHCNERVQRRWYHIHWISNHAWDSSRALPEPLCDKLRQPRRSRLIYFEVAPDGSWQESKNDRRISNPGRQVRPPELYLADLLQCSGELTPIGTKLRASKKYRFGLGSRIARSMLCLVGSSLTRSRWKANNLLVALDTDAAKNDAPVEVYMNDVSDLQMVEDRRHMVLDLGVLLWELFLMRRMVVRAEDEDDDEDITIFNALNREHGDREDADLLEPAQLDVIENCLNMYAQVGELEDEKLRAELYIKIVKPLGRYTQPLRNTPGFKTKTLPRGSSRKQAPLTRIAEEDSHSNSIAIKAPIDNLSKNVEQDSQSHDLVKTGLAVVGQISQRDGESLLKRPFTGDGCGTQKENDDPSNEKTHLTHVVENLVDWSRTVTSYSSRSHVLDSTRLFAVDSRDSITSRERRGTKEWLDSFMSLRKDLKIGRDREPQLKIAILDSGIDMNHEEVKDEYEDGRIKDYQVFVENSDTQDHCGHGTHIAGIVLELANNAHVYIAKITDAVEDEDKNAVRKSIVQALRHARNEWKVDMISMSFGYSKPGAPDEVGAEIEECLRQKIVVFASASNDGGNKPRTYPGNYEHVMCIHSSTSTGNSSSFSPSPEDGKNNFTVVGECIRSWWPTNVTCRADETDIGTKCLSGTSFATPVAVSIAAFMVGYIRRHLSQYTWRIAPMSPDGIQKIFQQMSRRNCRLGYDLVSPQWFFDRYTKAQIEADLVSDREGLGGYK